ncbi:MAG: GNAT family N-acetyltransferase [Bacteroidetes bacterium]|nr:GNAT family N-acetyltransferase [Bacteroidota bacterium]
MSESFRIRSARREDVDALLLLIRELAAFEKAPDAVINTRESLLKHGFGPNPLFVCWVAETNGTIAGMALCYTRYSTWKGPVLYLEDIIVTEKERGTGMGTALFETSLDFARQNGYARMSWQVLDWNEPAIGFYRKYGANLDPEWINCSLDLYDKPMD